MMSGSLIVALENFVIPVILNIIFQFIRRFRSHKESDDKPGSAENFNPFF